MHKLFYSFLLLSFYSAPSFGQKGGNKFEISGKVKGFADSTLIYLEGDSTYIVGNQFRFTGSIKESTKNVLLRTKNYTDYKFFWLENKAIQFEAEKGKFREATIVGSKTQAEQDQLENAVKKSGKEREESVLFIQKYPNSIISASVLSTYASTWGKDTASFLYQNLTSEIKNTKYGRDILEFITLNKNVKLGDQYVDFTEPNVEGKNVSLSDYKGKLLLLEFWGSWCLPCRKTNPDLVKVYQEFGPKGFEILGVAAEDNKQLWLEAIKKDGLTWQNVTDLRGDKNKAVLIYGVSYFPANFLIDQNGTIIAKDLRGVDLRSRLSELLK